MAPVFAAKGFHGTTTKDLARAAGVSEALLYRHFPSKKELYAALTEEHVADREIHPGVERLLSLPPSTERLVLTVEYFVAHIVDGGDDHFPRLMARSLLSDGDLARAALSRLREELGHFLAESLRAAREAGDLQSAEEEDADALWWLQHFALGVRLTRLPAKPPVRYRATKKRLSEHAVRFALRGIGLRPEAIERYYSPGGWKRIP